MIGEKKLVIVGHMLPAGAEKKHADQANQKGETMFAITVSLLALVISIMAIFVTYADLH